MSSLQRAANGESSLDILSFSGESCENQLGSARVKLLKLGREGDCRVLK